MDKNTIVEIEKCLQRILDDMDYSDDEKTKNDIAKINEEINKIKNFINKLEKTKKMIEYRENIIIYFIYYNLFEKMKILIKMKKKLYFFVL